MNVFEHPAFEGVDKRFIAYLQKQLGGHKTGAQMAQALIQIQAEAKRLNIQLTPERQQLIVLHLRNSLPQDKQAAFDNFIRLLNEN
jgi:hypothetical protein